MTRIQEIDLKKHEEGLAFCMKQLDIVQSPILQDKFLNQAIAHEAAIAQLTN